MTDTCPRVQTYRRSEKELQSESSNRMSPCPPHPTHTKRFIVLRKSSNACNGGKKVAEKPQFNVYSNSSTVGIMTENQCSCCSLFFFMRRIHQRQETKCTSKVWSLKYRLWSNAFFCFYLNFVNSCHEIIS